jgi:adenine-specific DNA-methyltransferase
MPSFNHQSLPPAVINRARSLRRDQSKSEEFLWELLRDRRLNGVKFRRQFPVPPYTVDFYVARARVAVELDGELHEGTKAADERRDLSLRASGIFTLRITTAQLFSDPEATLELIWSHVRGEG